MAGRRGNRPVPVFGPMEAHENARPSAVLDPSSLVTQQYRRSYEGGRAGAPEEIPVRRSSSWAGCHNRDGKDFE